MSDKRFFRTILTLFIAFLVWCCFHFSSEVIKPLASIESPAINDTVSPVKVKPGYDTLFTFEFNYGRVKDGNGEFFDTIRSINIIRRKDGVKIQTVSPSQAFEVLSYIPPFEIEDMNFDGYLDFRVLSFVMMRGQRFYNFWLYNPEKEIFEENIPLSETWDVEFDHENKTVISSARLVGPFDVRNETFTLKNGKLVLQHSEESEENPMKDHEGHIIMKKRIDGKLVERSKTYDTIPFTKVGTVIFNWDSLK
jgi:hypothetical protein